MHREDAEHRIRHMAFLYAREEHNVTASVSYESYRCKITLNKRDGSDVTCYVNPRASVIEVETSIDDALSGKAAVEPQPGSHTMDQFEALRRLQYSAYNPYQNALANAPMAYSQGLGQYDNSLGALLGLYNPGVKRNY